MERAFFPTWKVLKYSCGSLDSKSVLAPRDRIKANLRVAELVADFFPLEFSSLLDRPVRLFCFSNVIECVAPGLVVPTN